MSVPLLSVVIPSYNNGCFVAGAVASARAQGVPVQIIVVDDGSTDGTAAIVRAMDDVVYVRQDRGGIGAARNRGTREATGVYLAFLDADDLWSPAKTASQLSCLEDRGADIAFGQIAEFADDPDDPSIPRPRPPRDGRLCSAMLIRRATFERVGPFSSAWRVGEFVDWYLRAEDLGLRFASVPEIVLHRRLHAANTGRTAAESRGDYLRIIKSALDRRQGRPSAT